MRSIPGTITQYVQGQDQVELLDLTPAEREAKIKQAKVDAAQRALNEAQAELRAAQAGA